MQNLRRTCLVVSLLSISACVTIPKENVSVEASNLNSTLWVQTSAEYQANALQTYKAAEYELASALQDKNWTAAIEQVSDYASLPEAIVLDIDETVLDNSSFQANMLLNNSDFDSKEWDRWVSMQAAPAIPGAVEFINKAQRLGVTIIYITNRECHARGSSIDACPQKQETMNNLKRVGIDSVSADHFFLKKEQPQWGSEKQSRRELVAQSYRIIMLIGDDLGDFLPNVKSGINSTTRKELVNTYQDHWGVKWFVLSNPTYGSWMQVLESPTSENLRGF